MSSTMTAASIDTNPQPVYQAWVVCCCSALFFAYELIQMHMFSAINQDLVQVYGLSNTQLGILASVYLWANVLCLIPAGLVLDRVSTKRLMLGALALCVFGTMAFALVTHLWWAYLARFFTGVGSAFCLLACVRIATRWFPSTQIALITGMMITIAMLGGVFAQAPLAKLTELYGWRQALMIDSALGVMVMLLIVRFVQDAPNIELEQLRPRQPLGFWQSICASYGRGQNWLAALYTSLMNMPIIILGALWGTIYLTQMHALSRVDAAVVNTMIFVGMIVGGPLMGWWSDRWHRRRGPMIFGSISSLLLVWGLMQWTDLSFGVLSILFFSLGFCSSSQVLGYPVVSESNAPWLTATAVSIVSLLTQGGGIIYQPLFGWLLERRWDGTTIQGIAAFQWLNFYDAWWLLLIGFVAALIIAVSIKETYGQQVITLEP